MCWLTISSDGEDDRLDHEIEPELSDPRMKSLEGRNMSRKPTVSSIEKGGGGRRKSMAGRSCCFLTQNPPRARYFATFPCLGVQEVPVNWHEVSGSKLIQSKLDVITTSASMLRDMFCVRICYFLGVWAVAPEADQLAPGRGSRATPDGMR